MTAAGVPPAKIYAPRDPVALGRVVVLFLYAGIAVELALAVASVAEANVLSRYGASTPTHFGDELPLSPLAQGVAALIGLAQLVVAVVGGFLILKWIYRVSMNAHVLVKDLNVRPPWAVAWYFIPIANLFKPYQAMKETWAASENPGSWAAHPTPSLLNLWWALWLISNFVSNIGGQLSLRATDYGTVIAGDYIVAVGCVLSVPLNLVFIAMVRRLGDIQTKALSRDVFS